MLLVADWPPQQPRTYFLDVGQDTESLRMFLVPHYHVSSNNTCIESSFPAHEPWFGSHPRQSGLDTVLPSQGSIDMLMQPDSVF